MTDPAAQIFLTGFVLTGTLILAIGAQNAFVLRQGLRREHVLPIVLFCSIADFLLIAAGVAGLSRLIEGNRTLVLMMTIGGAAFIAWYGVQAVRRALKPGSLQAQGDGQGLTLTAALAQLAAFTFLNPHVYLDTVLLIGSIGAQQPRALQSWFVLGCACASAAWFFSLGFGARLLAPLFAKPKTWQWLDGAIGVTMLVLAGLLLYQVRNH